MKFGLFIAIAAVFFTTRLAQARFQPLPLAADWTTPMLIFGGPATVKQADAALFVGNSISLVAVGDQVHAFFNGTLDRDIASGAWHTQLKPDGTWTTATPILWIKGGINNVQAAAGADGTIYLTYIAGGLYFTQVKADQADSLTSWSNPIQLASNSIGYGLAARGSTIVIGYSRVSQVEGSAVTAGNVWVIVSQDGGRTWSAPSLASNSVDKRSTGEVHLAIDEAERVHIVWSEYQLPNGWPPTGVYYARSEDHGQTWTAPQSIVSGWYAQIGVGTAGRDEVHLLWQSVVGRDGTFHAISKDGGKTWSKPDLSPDGGGLSGLPSFAVDSTGKMHIVTGDVRYAQWTGQPIQSYANLFDAIPKPDKSLGVGPERGIIAITRGNRLHVAFEIGFQGIWYTSKDLGLPALPTPTAPLPTPTSSSVAPLPVSTPAAIPTPTAIPTRAVNQSFQSTAPGSTSDAAGIFVIAILPVVVLLLGVAIWRARRFH